MRPNNWDRKTDFCVQNTDLAGYGRKNGRSRMSQSSIKNTLTKRENGHKWKSQDIVSLKICRHRLKVEKGNVIRYPGF